MDLFQCRDAEARSFSDPATIRAPLGVVRLALSVGDLLITGATPAESWRLGGEGRLITWHCDDLDVSLLIARPVFSPPLDTPVDECWGVLWRVRAKALIEPLIFTAVWDEGHRYRECGPNGGQFLHAWIWGDGETDVTIGTQDEELLARRVRSGDSLPPEWESYFCSVHNLTDAQQDVFFRHPVHEQLMSKGIACPLPGLQSGQEIQIQFAVAWSATDEQSALATSLAVEASPAKILAGGECS